MITKDMTLRMTAKDKAFAKFDDRIKLAGVALGFAYRRYYKKRDEAEKELQKVLGEINGK